MSGKSNHLSLEQARKVVDTNGIRFPHLLHTETIQALRAEGREWYTGLPSRSARPATRQSKTALTPKAAIPPETAIRELCAIAGRPDLAGEYLQKGLNPEQVKKALLYLRDPKASPIVQDAMKRAEAQATGKASVPANLLNNPMVSYAARLEEDAKRRVN